ncbi:hemerythrin domain-containing protein [Streptomyces sp. 35G-GA-8]|uniref:hemerythrin domain-containing protein n=1 Tax=Streptomyces sp. 35G-GA-8 TaxID=2939434 RepID=UPI00201ECA44|nr:hemerythrin domain-containing protein [Streptomyces sp. 35G-GA-8]MCL7380830.1 hemerythrin domain-containing protein [Streptomyces sp. 35G-GA-8]
MYEELLAEHTIMRRGAALVAVSFANLADGQPVDVRALVSTSRWLIEYVRSHHGSEGEQLWPALSDLFPPAVAELDRMVAEHQALEAELHTLSRVVDAIAAREITGGRAEVLVVVSEAAMSGLPSAQRVHEILTRHFDEEEPVLLELFAQVPDSDLARVRNGIFHGDFRASPHLVLGLMEDPDRIPGYAAVLSAFPASVRWLRPVLLARYRSTKKALAVTTYLDRI